LCPTYLSAMATTWRDGRPTRAQSHLQFFGLREEPFSIVPQARFLCESDSQKRAHAGLRWLIDQHHGLACYLEMSARARPCYVTPCPKN
jgi:type II secretory pathway predicted ATPase ExeA